MSSRAIDYAAKLRGVHILRKANAFEPVMKVRVIKRSDRLTQESITLQASGLTRDVDAVARARDKALHYLTDGLVKPELYSLEYKEGENF